jgi:hypothetical protein
MSMNGSAAIAESCAFFAQQFPAISDEDDLRAGGQFAKELRWDCHSLTTFCAVRFSCRSAEGWALETLNHSSQEMIGQSQTLQSF